MKKYEILPIGKINIRGESMYIEIDPKFRNAIKSMDGFSHLNILWWFSDYDNANAREVLEVPKPYKNAPGIMGIFATRSPVRPNPLALSTVEVMNIDEDAGMIQIAYIDANDQSPVLDIKPYTPSLDRVETPKVPAWCSHWPGSVEESEFFDWGNEFNF